VEESEEDIYKRLCYHYNFGIFSNSSFVSKEEEKERKRQKELQTEAEEEEARGGDEKSRARSRRRLGEETPVVDRKTIDEKSYEESEVRGCAHQV